MSDRPTPETDSIIRNAQTADHPPTRLAATLTVKCGKLERERDEAREKYATEATEHMLAINKVCNERDEAKEEANKLSGAYEDATNYYARIIELKEELDEAREALVKILKNE